jgi:hypothetical protein
LLSAFDSAIAQVSGVSSSVPIVASTSQSLNTVVNNAISKIKSFFSPSSSASASGVQTASMSPVVVVVIVGAVVGIFAYLIKTYKAA